MRYSYITLLLTLIFISCGQSKNPGGTEAAKDTAVTAKTTADTGSVADKIESETVTRYIVVADTGSDYYSLRSKMYALHAAYKTTIDTMDRFYNSSKHRIMLPEDYPEDEMYAGSYYMRRDLSNTLSIEYLDYYQGKGTEYTMAVIAGIFENKTSADSLVTRIKPAAPGAFVLKSEIYIGCMH